MAPFERARARLVRAAEPLVNPPSGVEEAELRAAVAGKVVLVTGASYGLGEATARRLAASGATVLMAARSGERLEEIAAEIEAAGGKAQAHAADLTDMESVDALAEWVLAQHGHVDIVVSNAGKSIRRSVELSYDRFHDFERTIGVNYLGPIRLLLALLPSMRARGEGHIVNVSTIGARIAPGPRWGAYQASKSAFDIWLRSAAPELRADGVTATSVYMALIHTRMSAPTPIYRHVPGQTPDQAAETICRAIVRRPRSIGPWWSAVADVATTVGRRPWEATTGLLYRMTGDTAAARAGSADSEAGQDAGDKPTKEKKSGGSDLLFNVQLGGRAVGALRGAGFFEPVPLSRLPALGRAMRMGTGPAMLVALSAARNPERAAIADDRGEVSFAELDRCGAAIATGLREKFGVREGGSLAIMCRNHRGFAEAIVAGSRLGADLLLLGTDFPATQLTAILERERPAAIVHDQEFEPLFEQSGFPGPRIATWLEEPTTEPTLNGLAAGPAGKLPHPAEPSRLVILTSGTTGVPKSAPREPELGAVIGPVTTLLSNIPLRSGEPILVAPPFFHGYGLAGLSLGLLLGSTVVTQRRFDAEATLAAIDANGVRSLLAVPVMLDRILRCLPEVEGRHDTSSLRAVISGAAPLLASTSTGIMDAFGDILYNLYGSTETGFGAIAGPADLRAAPGTVGRAPFGTTLKVLDPKRRVAPVGEVGHVFIGGKLVFEGYSSGDAPKETAGDLMNTGDLGHLDSSGLLLIDGREDDMIVSGGENVFPQEVADVLSGHPGVADVAVVGVEDEEFGQRLRAYVVPAGETSPSADELRLHVKRSLPRFQIPRDVVFVEEIPRTASGKVRARELDAAT
ncbi:MAG TPA: SDR family NAD(P)-dependent oxidoreductase [Solirubrobacterales bacterium]|jgi:acyl-CoA synthetase (AMP-forming)/AMP-acid ligase II/NAD(P)-dependent dehydrogenase (short-subunit alcohol dehydrogenase family)